MGLPAVPVDSPPEVDVARAVAAADLHPMVPTIRSQLPQIVVSGLVPLGVFFAIRGPVGSDTWSLALVAVFPVGQILWDLRRHGRRDPLSTITLAAIAVGVLSGLLLPGGELLLKIRQSAFTGLFGLACLVSLTRGRPVMWWIARDFATLGDPLRRRAFDLQWRVRGVRRTFRVITLAWGAGLVAECAVQVVLALLLPTGTYLVTGQLVSGAFLLVLFGLSLLAVRTVDRLVPRSVS